MPSFLTATSLEDFLESALASSANLSGICDGSESLSGGRIERSALNGLVISGTRFTRLTIIDVVAHDLEAANSAWPEADVSRLVVRDSRLTGLQLQAAKLTDVVLERCKFDLVNLRSAELKRVTFLECDLTGSDFFDCSLESVKFEDCRLDQVDFDRARMRDVDLRKSEVENVLGLTGLAGGQITDLQAFGIASRLAQALGIRVEFSNKD